MPYNMFLDFSVFFWLFTNRKALYLPHYIDKDKIFLGE